MKRYLGSVISLLLWAVSTGYILITLSGETLSKALVLSVIALAINIVAIAFGIGVDEE